MRRFALYRILPWILVGVCLVVLLFFSGQDATNSHRISGGITNKLIKALRVPLDYLRTASNQEVHDSLNMFIRKMAHRAIFFAITLFLFWGIRQYTTKIPYVFLLTLLSSLVVACLDELHQYFSIERNSSPFDVFIDMQGALAALLLIFAFYIPVYITKKTTNPDHSELDK